MTLFQRKQFEQRRIARAFASDLVRKSGALGEQGRSLLEERHTWIDAGTVLAIWLILALLVLLYIATN